VTTILTRGALQDMANIYVDLILAHTSINQPIYLLGWSLGGQLALEVSYLLESRGAKDIKVFLLDSVMNSEPLSYLRKQLNIMSELPKVREMLRGVGITDKTYIKKVLQVYPLETAMGLCQQSGELKYAEVTLFKAGMVDERMGDDVISKNISRLIIKSPDNNVAKWVEKPLTVRLLNDRHHGNILESTKEIKMGILESLVLGEAIELI
jgi:hypothetical protein